MRFWFNLCTVDEVMIRKGYSHSSENIYSIFVYIGEKKKLCGRYTGVTDDYEAKVECGCVRSDSVSIEVNNHINIFDIEIYQVEGKYTYSTEF